MTGKVAIVFSGDFPEGNTKNARLKNIARGLRKSEYDVEFVSVFPSRFSKTLESNQLERWDNFPIHFLCFGRRYPKLFILRIAQMLSGYVGLLFFALFRSRKYRALYFYNPRWADSLFGLVLVRLFRKKAIVDQTELYSSKRNKLWHRSEEWVIAKCASELLVISRRLERHFNALRHKRVHYYPIMVDVDRFVTNTEEQQYLIGYIGSFGAKDGVDTMLQAFQQAQKTIPAMRFRLIGYNRNPEGLKIKVEELGLGNSVEVTGTVEYEHIPKLLAACDTLIMNRDSSDFATYGYPIKLGEYLACNKPVLMSDGKGFAEDFTDGEEVYKFEVDSPSSLAEVMLYRYAHTGESDAVAKRGYRYAKDHFDSQKLGMYMANVIDQIT